MAPVVRTISVSTPIAAKPDTVFALIIDLPGYNKWLPHSTAYKGTTEVSDAPIVVGSKYVEKSPAGTRYGEVSELDFAKRRVAFKQPMRLAIGLELQIRVDMEVKEARAETNSSVGDVSSVVERTVGLEFPWYMVPVAGVVRGQFEEEIKRTMTEMKHYLERQAEERAAEGG
ncbi:polyketide cyclase / dehydrase and lipid transport domain-containing protein [Sarocladium implicatum]|nr:polyketide cyclase / dehydrase and lipid transport domain-containing protein [Sarocladium implicatum]